MLRTQALVHTAVGQQPTIKEIELEDVAGAEVLVKMVASG